ncbi:MAG TPA: exopolysaccharide biosynthesis polyprenyl glycosylphosphotransferase [Ramlibacter sp.]|jgi:putative colanic acid biosynthesis UDP-glucose lipid carrier transferase|uniref:exopolysaccharide biosynthesis polyprenyl glycosylphosphotransferase n=1 Tax=Ramlibacter sp. TaxID=1917967 RepID=UPI002D6B3FD1|nr:exopolysaccharide biosynthesis polyprenyl glycosylphosphotransferase [Ramlibacter sp.]HZY18405.1 exopolysaccharide biosynthesis polyprenyl glycosylphosphotransferase [Ramlibacter sp.]
MPWRLLSTVTALDAAAVVLAYLLALQIWSRPSRAEDAICVAIMVLLSLPGSAPFRQASPAPLVRLVLRWTFLLLTAMAVGAVAGERLQVPRALLEPPFLLSWGAVGLCAVLLSRIAAPRVLGFVERRRKNRKVVIVGINEGAVQLGRAIQLGLARGQELAGYLDDRVHARAPLPDGSARVGRLSELGEYVRRHHIDRIYVALPMSSSPRMKDLLQQTHDTTASVYLMPNLSMLEPIRCGVSVLAGVPMVAVCESPFHGGFGILKRALDLGLTLAAMPLLLPLLGGIALLVWATSDGPVFFKQRRFGLDGEEILVWKFRTMTTLEDGCTTYRQATTDDDRITPVGRLLRRTSLDELPQFLNVLMGTMSIVGPRPHALAVNDQCRKLIPRYMLRHKVKPGITGWAQVNGLRGGDDIVALRRRTECDLQYLNAWSVGLDLLIIWKTAVLLVRGDSNAY